jgi:hypothetical protein
MLGANQEVTPKEKYRDPGKNLLESHKYKEKVFVSQKNGSDLTLREDSGTENKCIYYYIDSVTSNL